MCARGVRRIATSRYTDTHLNPVSVMATSESAPRRVLQTPKAYAPDTSIVPAERILCSALTSYAYSLSLAELSEQH